MRRCGLDGIQPLRECTGMTPIPSSHTMTSSNEAVPSRNLHPLHKSLLDSLHSYFHEVNRYEPNKEKLGQLSGHATRLGVEYAEALTQLVEHDLHNYNLELCQVHNEAAAKWNKYVLQGVFFSVTAMVAICFVAKKNIFIGLLCGSLLMLLWVFVSQYFVKAPTTPLFDVDDAMQQVHSRESLAEALNAPLPSTGSSTTTAAPERAQNHSSPSQDNDDSPIAYRNSALRIMRQIHILNTILEHLQKQAPIPNALLSEITHNTYSA